MPSDFELNKYPHISYHAHKKRQADGVERQNSLFLSVQMIYTEEDHSTFLTSRPTILALGKVRQGLDRSAFPTSSTCFSYPEASARP